MYFNIYRILISSIHDLNTGKKSMCLVNEQLKSICLVLRMTTFQNLSLLDYILMALLSCCQNCSEMQYCQVPGPLQCPERIEDKQCCCVQSRSYQHQHSTAPCHLTQHDGSEFSPAVKADLRPHQTTFNTVSYSIKLCHSLQFFAV